MGGELVDSGKTWLEVVKAAAHVELHDAQADEHHLYPSIIRPSWISVLNDSKDGSDVQSGSSGSLRAPLLRREDISRISESFDNSSQRDEQSLVKELKEILNRSSSLSKESFLGLLGPYLLSLRARHDESMNVMDKSPELVLNEVKGTDEKSTLSLLKKSARRLGQRLVSTILECSVSLEFWAPVQVLLECGVVVSNSCLKLVQSLVEEEQAPTLCLYITNVPDLTPRDVHAMLTFFLDSIDKPSKSFQVVRREWRRVAKLEIEKAGKRKRSFQSREDSLPYNLDKIGQVHDDSVSSAIGVAMAVDGFSSPQLCLHHLLVSGQDEAVLSTVVSQLNTRQVLKLVEYLDRWIEQYSSHLANFPTPKNRRVPSLAQVLVWAGVVLEVNFTKFVLSADFHSELKSMTALVQSLVAVGTGLFPLVGITEHLKSQSLLPVGRKQSGSASDYVIELLDMS